MKSLSTLQISLGISVALHAALLTVRLVDPQRFDRMFQDKPLEIILVNAKSDVKPDKATAIAQASLAGGGEQEKGRATSPSPPSALIELGNDEEEEAQRKIASLKAQQNQLLLQIKQALSAMPLTDLDMPSDTPSEIEQQEKRKKLVKLLAEIEQRINEENARPKKRYISPATREAAYALYYDTLRRKIEAKGTQNFPQLAGKKLYGELTMTLTINFSGRVLDTEVVQSSGNRTLDRHAKSIVASTGPFPPFSPAMRKTADQIVVVSNFNFAPDNSLQTKFAGH